jgi:hypothetical protein
VSKVNLNPVVARINCLLNGSVGESPRRTQQSGHRSYNCQYGGKTDSKLSEFHGDLSLSIVGSESVSPGEDGSNPDLRIVLFGGGIRPDALSCWCVTL